MAIADDILIDYTNKRIYGESSFLSGSTFYSVNQLYTYIMETFDDANQMDDSVPFGSSSNVLTYFVANGWYVQQDLVKHLKGASLETSGYLDAIRVITLSGGHTIVSGDVGNSVSGGTTGDSGTLLDVSGNKIWVRMNDSGDLFDETETITCNSHSGTSTGASVTGEELFSNVVSVGTVSDGYAYIEQSGDTISSWWGVGNSGTNNYHIDVLVKVKEADTLIDSGILEVYNRTYENTYDNTSVDCSGGGRNVAPLATESDSGATFTSAEIAAYISAAHGGTGVTAQIAVSFGSYTADIDDNTVNEDYTVQVDCDSQPMSVVYQALQWMCDRSRTSQTLNGNPAELYQSANSGYTPTKKAPFAQLAGSTLIFSRGVYPVNVGTGSYISTDNSGTQHTPPSTISVAVTGVVSGDRVSVFPASNGSVNKAQFTSHTSSNVIGNGTFVVSSSIPKDTPQTGYVRVVDASASTEQRYQYASWAGSTFTLSGGVTLTVNYNGSDTAYVGYIDEQASSTSVTKSGLQYVSDRAVIVRVRNSGDTSPIIPFEVQATITSNGLSVPASRNPDNVIG